MATQVWPEYPAGAAVDVGVPRSAVVVLSVDDVLATAADVEVELPTTVVPVIARALDAVMLPALDASAPDEVVVCTIEVRAVCIAEEVSDGLVEPVGLELGPDNTCEVVAVIVLGPPEELCRSSSDAVELRDDAAVDAATSVTLVCMLVDANARVAAVVVVARVPADEL